MIFRLLTFSHIKQFASHFVLSVWIDEEIWQSLLVLSALTVISLLMNPGWADISLSWGISLKLFSTLLMFLKAIFSKSWFLVLLLISFLWETRNIFSSLSNKKPPPLSSISSFKCLKLRWLSNCWTMIIWLETTINHYVHLGTIFKQPEQRSYAMPLK